MGIVGIRIKPKRRTSSGVLGAAEKYQLFYSDSSYLISIIYFIILCKLESLSIGWFYLIASLQIYYNLDNFVSAVSWFDLRYYTSATYLAWRLSFDILEELTIDL